MRLLIAAFVVGLALPAAADPCRNEIAALFDGGPLDPFAQPPNTYDTTVTSSDGAVKYEFTTVFDTPLKSMSGLKGQMVTLMIANRTWVAPGPDGPWTESPNQNPDDMEAFQKSVRDQMAANIRDAECPGLVDHAGQSYRLYRYVTQTDPNPDMGGSYFGATYSAFIDPETGRLMRLEQRGAFAHYQPKPGGDLSVSVYRYDPAISLSAPAE